MPEVYSTQFSKISKKGMKVSTNKLRKIQKMEENHNLKTFSDLIEEIRKLEEKGPSTGAGGQKAGKFELVQTDYDKIVKWLNDKKNFDVENEVPDFKKKFEKAKQVAKTGRTKRKDMPVINDKDAKKLQARLENGTIDINKPFADDTDPGEPFPEGLSGMEAKKFLERGLKDGSKTDDIITVTIKKKSVADLKPIQKQIYLDKSIGETANFGVKASKDFISNKSFLITSEDDFIIDGHHRWLTGMLLDPKMKVNTLSVDLPIKKLLPLSKAFGDALGNKRNQ